MASIYTKERVRINFQGYKQIIVGVRICIIDGQWNHQSIYTLIQSHDRGFCRKWAENAHFSLFLAVSLLMKLAKPNRYCNFKMVDSSHKCIV